MEDLKGFVSFEGKEYPFSYSGTRLDLYPDKFDSKSLEKFFVPFERGKAIENIELCGVTSSGKNVVFEVPEQYSDQERFLSFNVYSIFEYEQYRFKYSKEDGEPKHQTVESKIRGIKFSGVDVDIFYPPERAFSIVRSHDEEYQASVYVKQIQEVPLGAIIWRGTEVTFSTHYLVKQSWSSMPLCCTSELVATFSDEADLAFVQEIYFAVYQLFRYVMRRNNIVFDSIEIFDVNEDSCRYKFGHFQDLRRQHEKETHTEMKRRGLSYDCLGEKFADLVMPFLEGVIYIDHLPANIDKRNTFGPDRMLFDFVAFEREYANLYPEEAVRSDKYIEAKTAALDALDELVSQKTGKVKKYLASFRKGIATDENSLADRLLVVINECKSIMDPFLTYELGKGYDVEVDEITPLEDIASKMNTLRNDMAHGNLDIRLDKDHIAGFSIIETVLYAMRLKVLGIEERRIQEGLIRVMGFNIRLDS